MWPTKEQSRFHGEGFAREFYGKTGEDAERSIKRTSVAGQAAQMAGRAKWRKMVINPLKARLDEPVLAVCDDEDEPTPAPVEAKPAAGVFAGLADAVVRVAADPVAQADEEKARIGAGTASKANNQVGVKDSWNNPTTRYFRLVRDSVEVTLPSGEVRVYPSTARAFEGLRLNMKKHIRFRGKLKEKRACAFEEGGKVYGFKLVPQV